jgi:hypothetical protein
MEGLKIIKKNKWNLIFYKKGISYDHCRIAMFADRDIKIIS